MRKPRTKTDITADIYLFGKKAEKDTPLTEQTVKAVGEVLKVAEHNPWLCMESCCGNFTERKQPR